MPIGSGLSGQVGFAAEGTYGTYATVTRFLEIYNESLKADVVRIESMGIGRGRVLRTTRAKQYIRGAAGSIELPVMTKGMNLLFKHMLGTHAAAQQGGTSEYLHTSTVDLSTGLAGLSLSCQVGRPDISATVRPFNYEGCKVASWELKCAVDDKLILMLDLDAETEQTSSSLEVASFAASDDVFIFTQGSLTLGGSSISVKRMSIKGNNGLAVDRRFVGNTKKEPLAAAEAVLEGELEFEFESLTRHGQLTAGTELTNLIATFDTGTAIPSGNGSNFKLRLTIPLLQIVEAPVNVGGSEVVPEVVRFKALYDGSNNPFKIENWTTDMAA